MFDGLKVHHRGFYICQACFENDFVESNEVQLIVAMSGGETAHIHWILYMLYTCTCTLCIIYSTCTYMHVHAYIHVYAHT